MELPIIFSIGFIASFFGSFTSAGTSILSVALLGAYGLPILTSIAMLKVGTVGSQIGGFYNYLKAGKIMWRYIVPFVLIGSVGAFIGAHIVLTLDEALLSKIIGFAMLSLIPLTVLRSQAGTVRRAMSKIREKVGYFFYFLVSVWGSSFVIGAGIFNMFNQIHFFGMTILEVKGTAKIPGLVKSLVTLVVFIGAGIIDWRLSITFLLGMFAGAFIGTHYTIKIGDVWLRYILFATVIILAFKLIIYP